jgi:hypothetical protein
MPLPAFLESSVPFGSSFEHNRSHIFALRSYCKSVPIVGSMRLTVREPETWAVRNLPLPPYCCSNSSDPNCLSTGNRNIDPKNPHRRRCWYTHRDLAAQVSGNSVTVATRLQARANVVAETCRLKHLQRNSRSMQQASCSIPEEKSCLDRILWQPQIATHDV